VTDSLPGRPRYDLEERRDMLGERPEEQAAPGAARSGRSPGPRRHREAWDAGATRGPVQARSGRTPPQPPTGSGYGGSSHGPNSGGKSAPRHGDFRRKVVGQMPPKPAHRRFPGYERPLPATGRRAVGNWRSCRHWPPDHCRYDRVYTSEDPSSLRTPSVKHRSLVDRAVERAGVITLGAKHVPLAHVWGSAS
jgi:hypothetical protein